MKEYSEDLMGALEGLKEQLETAFGGATRIGKTEPLGSAELLPDSPIRALVRSEHGRPMGVFFLSNEVAPELIGRAVENASAAKESLPPDLAGTILEPLLAGDIEGRSYAVFPWRKPTTHEVWYWPIQRALLRSGLQRWLRGVARATAREPGDMEQGFVRPLESLATYPSLSDGVRRDAERACVRLRDGAWRPKHILSHGDMWKGNVLLDKSRPSSFPLTKRIVIIDWGGAKIHGYPFCDLARAAQTFRSRPSIVRREVGEHCRILGCEPPDAKGYLLAGLGHLGQCLEHFPRGRFVDMLERDYQVLDQAIAG